MNNTFSILQRVGRAFMLPIALLPVAGLFLGIGSSLTNPALWETYHLAGILGEGTLLHGCFSVLSAVGSVIFDNLPLLFAMGVALGMAENEKATAVLSAAIAFFVMHSTIGTLLARTGGLDDPTLPEGTIATVVGIPSLQMGVFGGILVGLGVAWLHNRCYKLRLPEVLSFFGGTRFVPIVSTAAYVLVGALLFLVWPPVQRGIHALGALVLGSGLAGTFLYGLIERLLIPFGLHHVFYLPFWQTGVGGAALIDGVLVQGAQNIFFAELASPATKVFSVSATRFMSGKFPLMIFGLPGAALAMYHCALPEKRRTAGSLLLSAALTSLLTGITEPLEFTFLFVSPFLYGIHCAIAGLSYMLMHALRVGVGMTFSGGLIDLLLFGILQGTAKTRWYWIPVVGVGLFGLYYVLFRWLIHHKDYHTPGREPAGTETRLYRRADYEQSAQNAQPTEQHRGEQIETIDTIETIVSIVGGLGGKENIVTLDCCATRLRVTVQDGTKVDKAALMGTGAAGVLVHGNGVQVVYGPKVAVIKSELEEWMEQ